MLTVVDYGMGNIWSVLSALRYLGAQPELNGEPDKVVLSDYIVLPGVGSFRKGILALQEKELDKAIVEAVINHGAKILGICLGMQLLGAAGTEDGKTKGLGLVANRVDAFTQDEVGVDHKIPHVGFNSIKMNNHAGIFKDIPDIADFYFTHSYRMLPEDLNGGVGICTYGIDFLAAFEVDNIAGVQFHPEKSQTNGLILLKNFLTN